MELYVDDMITKSVKEINLVKDLEEAFRIWKTLQNEVHFRS